MQLGKTELIPFTNFVPIFCGKLIFIVLLLGENHCTAINENTSLDKSRFKSIDESALEVATKKGCLNMFFGSRCQLESAIFGYEPKLYSHWHLWVSHPWPHSACAWPLDFSWSIFISGDTSNFILNYQTAFF